MRVLNYRSTEYNHSMHQHFIRTERQTLTLTLNVNILHFANMRMYKKNKIAAE